MAGWEKATEDRDDEGGERDEGWELTEGGVLLLLFLGGMYREVLDTALLASGPDGWQVGWIVTMEMAAMGLAAMATAVGLGWGGRNITEVTDAREGVGPGVKGRAVRFRTPALGLTLR